MPTESSPAPEDQPSQEPSPPPSPTRRAFQATPIAPAATPVRPPAASPSSGPAQLPYDPSLAPQVDSAKADLARRQSVAIDAIRIVEVRSVIWPDSSLGCPKPGMAYLQVQVDGLLIRLSIADRVFAYHSGGGKPPFLCEQKQ